MTNEKHQHFFIGVTIISGLLFYSSCKKESGPIIVLPPNPPLISLATDIQPIFTAKCATSNGCHKGSSPAGSLNLEAANSYTNLVNVISDGYAPALRVKPLAADNSVLWHKVANDNPGVYGAIMPTGGLQSFEIDNIKKWINEGANNN